MGLFSYGNLDGQESSYEADLGINSTHRKKRRRRKGLSNRGMKLFAGILFFIGMIGTSVIAARLPQESTDADLGTLSAVVACLAALLTSLPMYAWLLVRGFEHTARPGVYFVRLLVLAAVCEVPWDLATWQYQRYSTSASGIVGSLYGSVDAHPWLNLYTQNPVWALALSELILMCLAWIRRHQAPTEKEGPKQYVWYSAGTAWLLRFLLIFAAAMWTWLLNIGQLGKLFPLGLMFLLFVLIFYGLRGKENTSMMLAAAVGALEALAPAVGVLILHFHNDDEGFAHSWTRWLWYPATVLMMLVPGLVACWGLL